jgi:hypothetical protein
MEFGNSIRLPEIPALALSAMAADLPASAFRRQVKIYQVPVSVSADQYYVSCTEPGASEEAPPSLSRNTLLLARYTLSPDGDTTITYLHKEVQNAQD